MRDGFDPDKEASMDKFERVRAMIGYELYSLLDDYFRDLAREIRLNAPLPNFTAKTAASPAPTIMSKSSARKGKAKATVPSGQAKDLSQQAFGDELVLVEYYCKAYTRFSSGAAQINRLFAYLNRHFIMRAIDEGCGWISLADVVAASVLKGRYLVFVVSVGLRRNDAPCRPRICHDFRPERRQQSPKA